jgi:hypothetical protein
MHSHYPFVHPPQRVVFAIEGFGCHSSLFFPPFVDPTGHRVLQAVDLRFQSGVPGDPPLLLQPGFQTNLILNANRYRRPCVVPLATVGSRCGQNCQNYAAEFLNAFVDCHSGVQFRIERNLFIQVSFEVGPASSPGINAIRWISEG